MQLMWNFYLKNSHLIYLESCHIIKVHLYDMDMIMKKEGLVACVLFSTVTLTGCVVDTTNVGTNYGEYTPGYTGYTVSYGAYAPYYNGYSPSFWSPRYYYYTGYNNRVTAGNVSYHR